MGEFPKKIRKILDKYHKGSLDENGCQNCSSSCCSQGGFAILENVEMIYELYQQGRLIREDYKFPENMSFKDFVYTYFDVFFCPVGEGLGRKYLVEFYMRSLSSDDHLISIPYIGNYHDTRSWLFHNNPWLNKGCIFLNKKLTVKWPEDDGDRTRRCILHTEQATNSMTAKPIDCVFHICTEPRKMKEPSRRMTEQWYKALAQCYPNSVERFLEKVNDNESLNRFRKSRRKEKIVAALPFVSLLTFWIPFIGLIFGAAAVLTNTRWKGLQAALSIIALTLSIIGTANGLLILLR